MCVVSMIYDHYSERWWEKLHPPISPWGIPMPPQIPSKDEVEEFRKLLDRAREYDKKTGQKDCELEEKRDRVKKLADELGLKIDFL